MDSDPKGTLAGVQKSETSAWRSRGLLSQSHLLLRAWRTGVLKRSCGKTFQTGHLQKTVAPECIIKRYFQIEPAYVNMQKCNLNIWVFNNKTLRNEHWHSQTTKTFFLFDLKLTMNRNEI